MPDYTYQANRDPWNKSVSINGVEQGGTLTLSEQDAGFLAQYYILLDSSGNDIGAGLVPADSEPIDVVTTQNTTDESATADDATKEQLKDKSTSGSSGTIQSDKNTDSKSTK